MCDIAQLTNEHVNRNVAAEGPATTRPASYF